MSLRTSNSTRCCAPVSANGSDSRYALSVAAEIGAGSAGAYIIWEQGLGDLMIYDPALNTWQDIKVNVPAGDGLYHGVCDYSRPGVEQKPLAGTWLSYPMPGHSQKDDAKSDDD